MSTKRDPLDIIGHDPYPFVILDTQERPRTQQCPPSFQDHRPTTSAAPGPRLNVRNRGQRRHLLRAILRTLRRHT